MANKNCFIYETLNGVKEMSVRRENGMMTLSGTFGVCGVRNNNKRVYETSNYAKMVAEMKKEIEANNGIPGELEHPQSMNITLENISHKITDINIDENGLVTGTITLLNTPKGKIAQAIVEGGLPLFISSRATGTVDQSSGNVTLEKIATYDLVGSPGFSQARLKLNENQIAEAICESVYYVADKSEIENEIIEENNTIDDMEMKELLERFEAMESRIAELEEQNESLQAQIDENNSNIDVKKLADSIQKWIIEEYSPTVQDWIMEEFAPSNNEEVIEEAIAESVKESKKMFVNEMADKIQQWVVEEFAPEVQNWVVEEFAPEVQNWCVEEFAPGIQNWIIEEYAPETEKWLNESFMNTVNEKINAVVSESLVESKKNSLSAIDQTLKVLENLEATKPTYSRKAIITENNADEPMFVQNMPAEARVKWEMANEGVKESITRRAKLYNFTNEGAVERFWANIDFNEVKPIHNISEGLDTIIDERERSIRESIRSWRAKRS